MIFKRRRQTEPDPAAAIERFWAWWATARPRVERQIAGEPDDALTAEMGAAVSAIHPELDWEFTAGTSSRHLLVISAVGDPRLRSLAERWRRAGPPPDETFGYATARQGNPTALADAHLEIAGHRLDLAELRFSVEVDEDRPLAHVEVWHPRFPELPEGARTQITFLSLDWILGEDAVATWVGAVAAASGPGPSLTGPELAAVVSGLTPAEGQEQWLSMSGTRDGRPVVAIAQTPLRPARWPGHDLHIRVDVPYSRRDENGFPAKEAFPDLYALEDHIARHVDGAVLVAHETSDGVRTTHLYADRPAAGEALKPLTAAWPDGRVRITVTPDPAWERVAHLA
ncbi:DUF695 domain-containing protein [Actinoplanes flavus]|uniref:DUF695 domain-containing protein n=1 Tax=Actinoplanes flavus TaxID=2820290 RepID=A0ABS3UHA1_9ACTN|nr:DUF695 domain-containing protein [Actinoplanes flavus]MBO3738159.1 DUF695 domain-containing protein [Actinoplanes flavus]